MAESDDDDDDAFDYAMVLNPDGTWGYGERIPLPPGIKRSRSSQGKIDSPSDHVRLNQAFGIHRRQAAKTLARHGMDIERCGDMTFGELRKLSRGVTVAGDLMRESFPAAVGGAKKAPKHRRNRGYMRQTKVELHIAEVLKGGDQQLIGFYLTGAVKEVAKRIGCSYGTFKKTDFHDNRNRLAIEWRRESVKPLKRKGEL